VRMVAFEDTVASVDVAGSTFTLGKGAVLTVTAQTRIGSEGIQTLQDVSDTLAAHKRVRAEGIGTLTSAGPPPAISALFVEFRSASSDMP